MNAPARGSPAFTLVETMLALLIFSLLAGTVAMNLSQPLNASRAQDAFNLIRTFDATTRRLAESTGRNVRLGYDLAHNRLVRTDGGASSPAGVHQSLPAGCELKAARVGGRRVGAGEAFVDVAPHGWSATYAVQLQTPAGDEWIVFAGLSGQASRVKHEADLPHVTATPGDDAH